MSREVIVKPLGLVTRPNLYGQYEVGALSQARNMVIRAPGILETAPATVLGTSFGATNAVVHQLLSLPSTVMYSWVKSAGSWDIFGNSTGSTYLPITLPSFSSTGRISPTVLRDRIIVSSSDLGHYVCDPLKQTPPAEFRKAGFAQPIWAINSIITANAQAIPLNTCAGYAVLFKRAYDDGYLLRSRPSPIYTFLNNGANGAVPNDLEIFISLGPSSGAVAGDGVEVYRTDIVPQATFDTDPGTTLKKIISITLAAAHVSAGFIIVADSTVPGPLNVTSGEALYTNPGQEGALAANRYPETSQCAATFKNYAFYGNITQRPQFIFSIRGGISSTAFSGWDTAAFRQDGVGTRVVTCTVTNGSATVTGVSATHMLGVAVGQDVGVNPVPFPNGTQVQSFNTGAGTITMTSPANAGAASIRLFDVVEINGQRIEISGTNQDTLSNIAGFTFEVTTSENVYSNPPSTGIQALITYVVEPYRISVPTPLTFRATNGQNYVTQIPSFPAAARSLPYKTYKNLLTWSKDSQPEHVPVPNQTFVGVGEIIALESTRDALWIFCTDGLFRLSGDGGSWRVDTMDTTLVLSAPRASCVLSEVVYAYTNRGFVRITDAGVESLSERIIGDLLPGVEYTETASIIVERNEAEDEIVIRVDATEPYVYSVRENAFTTLLVADVTAMTYVRYPVSGLACLAFGRSPSGSTPRYELWNSTTNWLAGTTRFQPVFASDPFSAKRWIDCSYIFSAASTGISVTCVWNGGPTTTTTAKNSGRYFNESRGVAAVPRNAATGNTLAPGFNVIANTVPARLYALSLRYAQNGEQQLKRT